MKTYVEISTGKRYEAAGVFSLFCLVAAERGISAPTALATIKNGVTTVLGRRFVDSPNGGEDA